ncbi:pilus assembly protein [Luteimonas sp. A478]
MSVPTKSRVMEPRRPQRLRAALFGLLAVLLASPGYALDIPDVPLQSTVSVPPNIMFILDDSGSMHGEITPGASIDEITKKSDESEWEPTNIGRVFPLVSRLYGGSSDYANIVADPDNVYGRIVRTAQFNVQYYNPEIEYLPWAKAEAGSYSEADPECAYWNPENKDKGCVNLTTAQPYSKVWWQRTDDSMCTDRACVAESGTRTIEFNIYYTYDGGDKYESSSYTRHSVVGDELKNFANWFQYYRTRILASRGGIGRAFSSLSRDAEVAPRVGYATLNSSPRVVRGVRPFAGDDRIDFYNDLYTGVVNGGVGTPSRRALRDVGDYYESEEGVDDPWRTDVGNSSGSNYNQRLQCRQSFAMLMTDGYWNDSGFSIAGGDSTAGYPFQDDYENTLADVAYHYWSRDLRTGMGNKVPASPLNPNTHQHMVTYGIGLGVEGTISSDFAFSQIGKDSGTPFWPNPTSNEEHKIDDLLHAAVNSRGGFYSAADPETFSRELRAALNSIIERVESGSNVAANSVRLDTETRIFQASYVGGRWTGELASYPIINGKVSTTPSWRASQELPGYTQRKSTTFTDGGTFYSQRVGTLGTDLTEYLLGSQDEEEQNGGPFRDRSSVLGDIVNSSPAFTSETSPATIFVGANDGMLHAFNATTGKELFAYVPSSNLIPDSRLEKLAEPDYEHLFFVDGPITVSTQSRTPDKNLLVGTLGRGGPGLFALDVSKPASFDDSNVLWEASPSAAPSSWGEADREDLGLILNKPLIVRTNANDGKGANASLLPAMAIFGNGINSGSGNATLFIVDAESGQMVRTIRIEDDDNGITSIQAWDEDGDGVHDFVFAADLKGNVWKFDLDFGDPKDWGLADGENISGQVYRASGGNPLIATGRPITGGLQVAFEPRTFQRWVFFGTGKYLEAGDPLTTDQQRWYGVKDTGERITSDTQLTPRAIELRGTTGEHAVRAFQPYQALDLDSRGWYVNLDVPDNGAPSERMVSDPLMVGRVLVAASILPSSDPCLSGGTGYLNSIDAFSGTATQAGFFDVDGDGEFDDDVLGSGDDSRPVGSVDLNISMPTSPTVVENLLIAGGSLGTAGEVGIHNPLIKGRISWREIVGD